MGKFDCYEPGDPDTKLRDGTGIVRLLQDIDGETFLVGVLRRWNNGAFQLEIDNALYEPMADLTCDLVGGGRHQINRDREASP